MPGPSFEDILSVKSVGSPAISPDGRTIAYTVRTTDWDENRYDTEIWLVRNGEEPFQLTRTKEGSSDTPRWSPDGKWIAFLADRGEKQQIHLIRAAGGEAWALTEADAGAGSFAWSPNGKQIAFTATEPESEADKQRKERYGGFAVEDAEYRLRHLWLVDIPGEPGTPEARRLTEGTDFTVTNFDWSPGGSRIALEHRPDPLINSWMRADISILDVASGQVSSLVTATGYDGNPNWSPDGRWIAYQSSGPDIRSAYYTNGLVFKIPAEGGTPIRLAADLDEDPGLIDWTQNGIYLSAWQKMRRQLFIVDANSGRTRPFATTPENIWSVDFSLDGRTMALAGRTPATLTEVYRSSVSRYRPVPVTNMSEEIDGWELGTSEIVAWNSEDGTRIEGVLHKPDNFDPSRRYPLFVVIHGGPTGIDYPVAVFGSVYPVHQWLAKGALVLRPNYRGSAGYGEAFRSLNVRNLGVGDAWDVLSGVDHVVEMGIVDTTRMGAMGWSQGGYISAFLTTNTSRFAAVSVGAGISNWVTYYVNTDIHPFTRQYLKATPWDDPEVYAKTSPMTSIRRARTPTLIQHGEFDRRVPIPNAFELYQGLQDMGVEAKLIVYKGFGHGINKPKERLAAMWHNWQWFGRHIWDETIELPLEITAAEKTTPQSRNR
ncbi:MAG: prolyl oligopeptidase family serine peptidase [Gemmatimonadales bacterium]|nr:prolyl oligopeptidase family serine peptidase [Gemmatimonadales bacterium]NIN11169.1 prolyl oligopeptidase family serine peptidase [Gemmatimonadales bacterium]NIN49768.1 prolyl oligopeptidase family serine peptidase [Gemmatimonadales bacterium]NIP07232.1 prolyl oligopeptidase family serine peptidase [Gemmatimonadales bacterium]NIR00445.1 prolyl oligopeptidase family serine peptidase [Gemmatimonadales bacterium]